MKHELDVDAVGLRCLVATVRACSVTVAAQSLGMGQPALSHVLARLRRRFDDPLLVRGSLGMTPTPRGLSLAAAAAEILERMNQLDIVQGTFDPALENSRFVITVTDYFEKLIAPALMKRLHAEAPGVCVEWRTPNPLRVREWLESGEVDLRIAWIHAPWSGLRFTRLFSDRLVCLVREGHPVVGRKLTMAQFTAVSHVRPAIAVAVKHAGRAPPKLTLAQYLGLPDTPSSKSRSTPRRSTPSRSPGKGSPSWRDLRNKELHVGMLAQSMLAIPSLVQQSDLLATLPGLVLEAVRPIDGLRVLTPPLQLPALQGALYWHERTNNDPRHRWFRRLVSAVAKSAVAGNDAST